MGRGPTKPKLDLLGDVITSDTAPIKGRRRGVKVLQRDARERLAKAGLLPLDIYASLVRHYEKNENWEAVERLADKMAPYVHAKLIAAVQAAPIGAAGMSPAGSAGFVLGWEAAQPAPDAPPLTQSDLEALTPGQRARMLDADGVIDL